MKKTFTFLFIAVALVCSMNVLGQTNLIDFWNGYNSTTSTYATGAGSQAKYWGWSTSPATAEGNWNTANGSGNIRFADNVSGYATGRLFYIRWDGVVSTSGKYYFKLDSINVSQLTAGHSYTFTWSYAWNSNASAPTLTTSICTAKDGTGTIAATSVTGTNAAISGTNETFPCNATSKTMTTGTITFIPPTTGVYYISFGANTASLCAIRDLSLVDNGVVSYISTSPATLAYTPNNRVKTVNIQGGGLSSDLTLSTKTGNFTLSKTTISIADATAIGGVNVVVTSTGGSDGVDTLSVASGSVVKKVALSLTSSLSINTRAFFCDQSTQDTVRLSVSGDLYNDISLTAPTGVTLYDATNNTPVNNIAKADALAGKIIRAKWDKSTRVVDQKITLTSGLLKDSVAVISVPFNKISSWDADTITTALSSLAASGWTQTDASGNDLGTLSQLYNTSGGIRIVPIAGSASAALHTYLGKTQAFGRTAYLRTWGAAAPFNTFNLAMNLDASTTYIFRGIVGWHNNVNAPNVTISVNTAKSGLGTSVGTQTVNCPNKQEGKDFGFEFTTSTAGTYYLEFTCDQAGDAMVAPDYLAVFGKYIFTSSVSHLDSKMNVIVNNGLLKVTNADAYSVYSIQGAKVADVKHNTSDTSVGLNQGVYLVKSAGEVVKVLVR